MGNELCEKCKPDKPEVHDQLSRDTGCDAQYQVVKTCMEQNRGSVSQCKDQWVDFKTCFSEQKKKNDQNSM